jgi:hypothetical protein
MSPSYATRLKELVWRLSVGVRSIWVPAAVCIIFSFFFLRISLVKDEFNQFFIQYAFCLSRNNTSPFSIATMFINIFPVLIACLSIFALALILTFSTARTLREECTSHGIALCLTISVFITPLFAFSFSVYHAKIDDTSHLSYITSRIALIFILVSICTAPVIVSFINATRIFHRTVSSRKLLLEIGAVFVLFIVVSLVIASPTREGTWLDVPFDHIAFIRAAEPFVFISALLCMLTMTASTFVIIGRRVKIPFFTILVFVLYLAADRFSVDSHPMRRPFASC